MEPSTPRLLSPLIEQAVEVAAQWHDATYRKGGWRDPAFEPPGADPLRIPVIAHLATVALIVARAGWDDETVAAALLHDVIEDANRHGDELEAARLAALVGEGVTRLVLDVTERKRDPDGRWLRWKERKLDYLDGLRGASARSMAVSLADKLHNLWSINEALDRAIDVFADGPARRRLSAGPDEQLWFYEAVLTASRALGDKRLDPLRRELGEEIGRFRAWIARQ